MKNLYSKAGCFGGGLLKVAFVVSLSVACSTQKSQFGSGLGKVPQTGNIAALEREMHARLNRDRSKKGLHGLKRDSRLADIARFHSHDMKKNDFFGHTSPNTGTLEDRLARAAYLAEVARENLAIAPNVQVGQDHLLMSPGHRANIYSKDVTHVGIGIVHGSSREPGSLTITQVFGKPLRTESPGEAKSKIERRIQAERGRSGLGPISANGKLTALARKHIRRLGGDVSGMDIRRVGNAVKKDFSKKARKTDGAVVAMAQNISSGDDLQISSAFTSKDASSYGIALRRVKDKKGRPQMVVLLLVLFSSR